MIDEAVNALEPSALLPLSHGAEHLVLVGDHKQVSPVIVSRAAYRGGLSDALFERLIEGSIRATIPSVLLNIQRRMHSTISAFPNSAFYSGALIGHPVTMAGASIPSVEGLHGSRLLSDSRVALIYTSSPNDSRSGRTPRCDDTDDQTVETSTRNVRRVRIPVAALSRLLPQLNDDPMQIGVIVPYLAQKDLVCSVVRDVRTLALFARV